MSKMEIKHEIEDLPGERRMDIRGYEGLYMVSDMGRVKSYDKIVSNRYGNKLLKGKILKPNKMGRKKINYLTIGLTNNHKTRKSCSVSRLVCCHFTHNPYEKPCVNHIDGDIHNNKYDNLERVTYKENMKHARDFLGYNPRYRAGKYGKHSTCKKVIQKDMNGNILKIRESTHQIERETGYHNTNIGHCCLGKQAHSHGYKREYLHTKSK